MEPKRSSQHGGKYLQHGPDKPLRQRPSDFCFVNADAPVQGSGNDGILPEEYFRIDCVLFQKC